RPQRIVWQRSRNQIEVAPIFARSDFVNVLFHLTVILWAIPANVRSGHARVQDQSWPGVPRFAMRAIRTIQQISDCRSERACDSPMLWHATRKPACRRQADHTLYRVSQSGEKPYSQSFRAAL